MAKEITIDSYIGNGYYSKQFIRTMLSDQKGKDVTINVSSLGGDLDHALDIHDRLAKHGKITIDYTGFNASSATVLSLNCKHIKMSQNSFYLIHKVMSWVDEWGYMNEDDIADLIVQLEKEKNENAKVTLRIALMYADKTGKPLNDIIDLMKEQTWLTAEEAKQWGFIDEVYNPVKMVNLFENTKMVAMIAAAGYPVPERKLNLINTMENNKSDLPKDRKSFLNWLFGMETEKPEPIDPKDQEITQLKNELEIFKAEKLAKVAVAVEEEKISDPKDEEITRLKNELETLKAAPVTDNDVVKNNDTKTVDIKDDFFVSIEEAKKLNAMVDQFE